MHNIIGYTLKVGLKKKVTFISAKMKNVKAKFSMGISMIDAMAIWEKVIHVDKEDIMAEIKYLRKWNNIDVFIGTWTNCDHDVIYGDAIDDYEFEYCPYCGVKLNEKDETE